jgi:O-antigen/teichoic acid export membrane protein
MKYVGKMIKQSSRFALFTFIAQVIGVVTSIMTRKFLNPEMMGIWSGFLVVLNYSLFVHLGVFTAITVKIPYFRGKGDPGEIQSMRNAAFSIAVVMSVVIIFIFLAASFFMDHSTPGYLRTGVRIIPFIIVSTLFYNLFQEMLRADKNFSLLSGNVLFNAVSTLVLIVVLTKYFKLTGMFLATLGSIFLSWIFIKLRTGYVLNFKFDMKKIFDLSKFGLPILISGVAYTILISIDKIMIIKMLGVTSMGFYSIAVLALAYTNTLPKLFGIVVAPDMQEAFGKTDSRSHIVQYVKQTTIVMAYLFPVLLASAYFVIPVIVVYFLPQYIPGVTSMKILLSGCFFLSLTPMSSSYAVTINKQLVLIPITVSVFFIGIVLNYVVIKSGYGIAGVAIATSVTYLIYFFVLISYAIRHSEGWTGARLFFYRIMIPFLYSIAVILAIEIIFVSVNPLFKGLLGIVFFCIAYIPVLWYLNRTTKILARVFKRT